MRTLIIVYLVAAAASMGILLLAGETLGGILLVLFALPWSLFVSPLTGLLGLQSATLNLALLAVGVGINAALLYVIGRRVQARAA
ncbi:MAG: hypothetical protein EOM91_01205 [Sphingobacteriia bacterium]|nr:hypothetical protein [Sphingobacteriia bacterium]NCC37984.1 hypothetical protein [Gammaproteobacteria bacterium]